MSLALYQDVADSNNILSQTSTNLNLFFSSLLFQKWSQHLQEQASLATTASKSIATTETFANTAVHRARINLRYTQMEHQEV